jgi:hypothetical protein
VHKLLRRAALTMALTLPATAWAGDRLKGLEMDVMLPGETPLEAVAAISLPVPANAAPAVAADARDNAAAASQENLEQAQKRNGAARHPAPPTPRPAPQRLHVR